MPKAFSEWTTPIFTSLAVMVISWAVKEFWKNQEIKQHVISFLITFSPVFLGLLTFFIYWLISGFIKMPRFNNRLEEWIGFYAYPDQKGGFLYTDLKGKIKRYIHEELEENNLLTKKGP